MMSAAVTGAAVVETAPLSPGQERLIAAEFALPSGDWPPPGSPSRMRPLDTGAIHILGHLNTIALHRALEALVERQSALRTVFRQLPDGTPVQLVLRHRTPPFREDSLARPDPRRLPDAVELLRQAGPSTVDPRQDPLFRAQLIRLQERDHVLLLQIHHMISDGWSIGVLYRDLSALYNAEVSGDGPDLPDLDHSFAAFSRQMHAERAGSTHDKQLQYWRSRLAPPLASPTGACRGSAAINPVNIEPIDIDASAVAGLRAAANGMDQRGGLAGAFLAALAIVLHHATGATDVRIGMMISNRARPDAEHLVGYFVNTAVIRLHVTSETAAGRLIADASLAVTEAIENQALPIQDLVHDLRESGVLDTAPLYEVTVALNTMRAGSLSLNDLTCEDLDVDPRGQRLAPTSIAQRWVLEELTGGLTGTLSYRSDIVDRPGATAILHNLKRAVLAVTDRNVSCADIIRAFEPTSPRQ